MRFARVTTTGLVEQVIVTQDFDTEIEGIRFCRSLRAGHWVQADETAGIGMQYKRGVGFYSDLFEYPPAPDDEGYDGIDHKFIHYDWDNGWVNRTVTWLD